MNLIITCGNLKAGGAERVISILSNKFVAQNIDINIYTWYKTEIFYPIDSRVRIHQIPIESGKSSFLGQMKWFRNQIKQKPTDVILGFLAPFNILTRFSTLGISVPVLVAERNDPYFVSPSCNGFWKIIRNLAYKMSDGVLVQTAVNKKHFPKYIQKKSTIIYNPVNFSAEKIGLALSTFKRKEIVSVTRLEKQKNIAMLIDAFNSFRKSHPDYKLTIYGEGQERARLEQKIKKLNLTGIVLLPGKDPNVHEKMVEATMFVMASNFEGMSNSLIEAMCLGLPCISTKVSGAIDLIDNYKNGILIDVGDTYGMTKAMEFVADNFAEREMISRNASKLFEMLNVDAISEQWLNYILGFVKKKSHSNWNEGRKSVYGVIAHRFS